MGLPLPLPAMALEAAQSAEDARRQLYMSVHRLAVARGLDPDVPARLRKVTETV